MSVRTDVVNLQINVNCNKAQAELGTMRKRAADLNFEMKGLKKNTEEYKAKAQELQQVTKRMDELKKSIGITSLTMKELIREQQRLNQLRNQTTIGSKDFQEYTKQLDAVSGRLSQVRQGTAQAQSTLSQAGSLLKGAGIAVAAGAIAAASGAVLGFITDANEEFREADKITRELKNTLDNLGKSDSFDRLTADAQDLADAVGFIDNDDLNKATQQLLTYGKLTEKQIRELLPVITDFAVKTGQDIPSATEQLIGALEGNGKALKQYGINIKDGETVTERFGIVMTDLKGKVEGAAKAFGDSEEGAAAKELQKFKNLQEEIGSTTGPLWLKIKTGILEGVQGIIQGLGGAKKAFGDFFRGIYDLKGLRADRSREQFGAASEAGIKSARSYLASVQGFTPEQLEKELKAQRALLELDSRAVNKGATINNVKEFERSRTIVEGLEAEIALRKEKIDIADKGEPTAEEKATAKQIAEYKKRLKALEDFTNQVSKRGPATLSEDQTRDVELNLPVGIKFGIDPERTRKALEEQVDALLKTNLEFLGRRRASLQLKADITQGRERLDFILKDLETEKSARIAVAGETGEEIADIEEFYRLRKLEAVKNQAIGEIQQITDFAQQGLEILSTFDQARANREQAELQRYKAQSDAKKKLDETRLKSGLISQAQYNKRVAGLDEELDKKQKELSIRQFKRQQKFQVGQAILSGLQGVMSVLAAVPGPLDIATLGAARLAQIAFTTLLTGAQVAAIASQKPPEAARGLIVPGSTRHSDGGIDLYDRKQKRVVANVESGEPLWVFSRNTYRNNKGVLDQLMYNSQNRDGASIMPSFSGAYTPINSSRLVPMMQNGGIVNSSSMAGTSANDATIDSFNALRSEFAGLRADINNWNTRLRADVSLYDIQEKENLLEQSRAASGLNQ